jgi:hypothetical protein
MVQQPSFEGGAEGRAQLGIVGAPQLPYPPQLSNNVCVGGEIQEQQTAGHSRSSG